MKEEDLTTGPAIATEPDTLVDTATLDADPIASRKILIDVKNDGALSFELSEEFKLYEVYGVLATTFIDLYVKNTLIPILNESQELLAKHVLNVGNQLAAIITKQPAGEEQKSESVNPESNLLKEIEQLIASRHKDV